MNTPNKNETTAIRTQLAKSPFLEHSNPLYLTSSFVFEDAEDMRASFAEEKNRNIYSRFSNPNNTELVDKLCQLEGAEAGHTFATGMGAIFSSLQHFSIVEIMSCLLELYLVQHILCSPKFFPSGTSKQPISTRWIYTNWRIWFYHIPKFYMLNRQQTQVFKLLT